jgi:hypothetical protein
MMEDTPQKAKQAGADAKLVMMALAAVLAAQHFPSEVDDWEDLPAGSCTWQAWKVAFRLAHLKRQRQLQALGGGKPLGGAHTEIPTAAPTIDGIGKEALENLALAASNDTTVLQQLTVANLALTALVTLLTAANKKLADALARNKGGTALATLATLALTPTPPIPCLVTRAFPGNYCWTHGHRVNCTHTSATCTHRALGHKEEATTTNMMGGSEADMGWNSHTIRCGRANLVHCDSINSCKNNYYYALLIEPAPTPTSTFPHQHMGIADSGSSSFYFSCSAPVANYNPRAPTVSITVANDASNTPLQALLWPPFPHFPHQQWQAMSCLLFPIPSLVWALLPTRAGRLSSTKHRSQSTIPMATDPNFGSYPSPRLLHFQHICHPCLL